MLDSHLGETVIAAWLMILALAGRGDYGPPKPHLVLEGCLSCDTFTCCLTFLLIAAGLLCALLVAVAR